MERFVDSFEVTCLESPCDGQGMAQETFRGSEKAERVVMELAIVQKFRAVGTSKPGNAKQALRHPAFDAAGIAEKHDCRTQENAVLEKPKPPKQFGWFLGSDVVKSTTPDRLLDGKSNFGFVEILD